jgi:hypothetical protein
MSAFLLPFANWRESCWFAMSTPKTHFQPADERLIATVDQAAMLRDVETFIRKHGLTPALFVQVMLSVLWGYALRARWNRAELDNRSREAWNACDATRSAMLKPPA